MRDLMTRRTRKLAETGTAMLALAALAATDAFLPAVPHASCCRQAKVDISSCLHMFTGIVEEMGTVVKLEKRNDMLLWDGSTGEGTELTVKGDTMMDGAYLG